MLRSKRYQDYKVTLNVTSLYKPKLAFHCEISSYGSYGGIISIVDITMNKVYKGMGKQFNGEIFTNLEAANRIFWHVNGEFYNNGSTTISDDCNIGVEENVSLYFKVSHTRKHYGYFYDSGYYKTASSV